MNFAGIQFPGYFGDTDEQKKKKNHTAVIFIRLGLSRARKSTFKIE